MKIFHCSHCQNLVFFENVQCVHCARQLAYSPGRGEMIAVEPMADDSGALTVAGADQTPYGENAGGTLEGAPAYSTPSGETAPPQTGYMALEAAARFGPGSTTPSTTPSTTQSTSESGAAVPDTSPSGSGPGSDSPAMPASEACASAPGAMTSNAPENASAAGAATDLPSDTLPDAQAMSGGSETTPPRTAEAVRLCRNYTEHAICNWALDTGDDNPLCKSCRLTRVIPSLDRTNIVSLWQRAETAKRRLVVNLLALGLPLEDSRPDAGDGMRFEFKEPQPGESVLTGHHEGTITLNLLEADDVLRERLRAQFEEPYRTVLGHLRHESGHYYWDRLLRGSPRLTEFQELFGDESRDYRDALIHHYQNGPREDWADRYISAYASVHPWEDWAETWAHYLHMVDTLETARGCGLTLRPRRSDEPVLVPSALGEDLMRSGFDALIDSWFPVTYLLNNLSRGLGLADAYPFVLNPPVIEKLRFVHDTVTMAREQSSQNPVLEAA